MSLGCKSAPSVPIGVGCTAGLAGVSEAMERLGIFWPDSPLVDIDEVDGKVRSRKLEVAACRVD